MVMRVRHPYNQTKHIPQVVGITDAELTAWFKDKNQGLDIQDDDTLNELRAELGSLEDLLGMTDEDIDGIRSSLSTSVRNHRGAAGQTHKLPIRTVRRLKGLILVFEYMSLVRRNVTLDNIKWPNVLAFLDEWKALKELTKVEAPATPKFNSQKGMAKHMHSMLDFFRRVYGHQMTTLSYLLVSDDQRDESSAADALPLMEGRFFCEKNSRIVDELHSRVSRATAGALSDNELVYKYMAESLMGTSAESLLQDFDRTRDGRGLWERLCETQCTDKVHETIAQGHLKFLQGAKWNGAASGDLAGHCEKHRRQHALYMDSAGRAGMQSYTDRTRVGWLLDSVKNCTDTNVKIRVNHIREHDDYMNDFDKAAVYLAKTDYEGKGKKKRVKFDDDQADVSALGGGGGGGGNPRKKQKGGGGGGLQGSSYQSKLNLTGGKGPKTGVTLRWYDKKEWRKLKKAERDEVQEWRATLNVSAKDAKASAAAAAAKAEKGLATLKDGFAKIAALFKKHAPEAASEADAIVSGIEGSIGSITVEPPAPSGEDSTANVDDNADEGQAEIGGSNVEVSQDAVPNDSKVEESKIPEELEKEIERQVEISAAVGIQQILKSTGGRKSD